MGLITKTLKNIIPVFTGKKQAVYPYNEWIIYQHNNDDEVKEVTHVRRNKIVKKAR